MTNTLIKSRYNKNKKAKPQQKINSSLPDKNTLPQNLQIFKNKLLSGNGFLIYK